MSENPAKDFKRRVANNGPKLKNVPNLEANDDEFSFADYVAKDIHSWAMVPDVDDAEAYVEEKAEEMYKIYERVAEQFDEVTVEREEDEMFWAVVTVSVPNDTTRRERLAEEIGEALMSRQTL